MDIDGHPNECNGPRVAKSQSESERKALGARLRSARMERGLTGVAVAEAVGAKPHTLWRWEKGLITPRPRTLFQLALVLGVEADWLLHGEGGAASAAEADPAEKAWREFESTGGAAFYRARGVTEEQIAHVRATPWREPPEVGDYVKLLEALASSSKPSKRPDAE